MKSVKKRLEEKYSISPGCWNWHAALGNSGYGHFWFNGRPTSAHRASYQIYVGPICDGLGVLHKCDNRLCVNPDHLFLGTPRENIDDMMAKNRQLKGSKICHAKLCESQIQSIREDRRPLRKIAAEYGVSHTTILHVKNNELWRHVP